VSGADDGLAIDDFSLTPGAVTTAAQVSISGRVLTADGRGIRNVQVTLVDSAGQTRVSNTTTFGYYHFNNIPAGEICVVSVSAKKYTFSQSSQIVSASDDITDINFLAEY